MFKKNTVRAFNIIAAKSSNNGIGFGGNLPWPKMKEDMKWFRHVTTSGKKNRIIMGKNTWKSLGCKELKDRQNIIVSRNGITLDEVLDSNDDFDNVCVIGGSKIFEEAMKHPKCKNIFVTEIDEEYPADVFFPKIPGWFKLEGKMYLSDNIAVYIYENKADVTSQENKYLESLKNILRNGEHISDRTGTGVISTFDENISYCIEVMNPEKTGKDLIYRIPLLTTKKMAIKSIIWELLWFLNGNTDATWLQKRDVKIWDGNSSREFLDSRGLDYQTGSIGPGYGHQWINWGGDWKSGVDGINQIKYIIELLKKEPTTRRAVLSAWNVGDLDKMALPPCHMMYCFKITNHDNVKKLNCKIILRSNDMFLGHPFNVITGTLLTILISRTLNIFPGKVVLSICDAHIYYNHIDQVKEQLKRIPLLSPVIKIDKDIFCWEDMTLLSADDFKLKDYHSWSSIKAQMAV